jgi:hypothetical protein
MLIANPPPFRYPELTPLSPKEGNSESGRCYAFENRFCPYHLRVNPEFFLRDYKYRGFG